VRAALTARTAHKYPRAGHGAGLGVAGAVDLVEVAVEAADPVGLPAAAGPLPHEGVAARPGDAAEELRAPARLQAEAGREVALVVGGLRLVRPLVGVRDVAGAAWAGAAAAEDRVPHHDGGVDARPVLGVREDVVVEAVEVRPVDARQDVLLLHLAAARRGVHGVPAVIGGGPDAGYLDVHPDHRVVDAAPAGDVGQGAGRLLRAPLVGLGGRPVPVRVDAGAAHEPVRAAADALVVGHEVGMRLRGVGRRVGDEVLLAAATLPVGPVPGHADVAAVGTAEERHAVRRLARHGDVEAVGAPPEPGRRVTGRQPLGGAGGPGARQYQCQASRQGQPGPFHHASRGFVFPLYETMCDRDGWDHLTVPW